MAELMAAGGAHPLWLHGNIDGMVTQEITVRRTKDGALITMDSVFYGEDGKRYTITGLGTEYVWGREEGSKIDKRLKPEWLASEYPDSWERWEADFKRLIWNSCPYGSGTKKCQKYADCVLCRGEFIKDAVRRAKALAGVE